MGFSARHWCRTSKSPAPGCAKPVTPEQGNGKNKREYSKKEHHGSASNAATATTTSKAPSPGRAKTVKPEQDSENNQKEFDKKEYHGSASNSLVITN